MSTFSVGWSRAVYDELRRLAFPEVREARNRYNRDWHARNLENARQQSREWRARNPKQREQYNYDWRVLHPGYGRKWRVQNREKVGVYKTQRRARKRAALVPRAEAAIKAIYDRATWYREQGWDVEVDHIFPLGFGWHEPANLQIIFASENAAKKCSFDFKPSVVFPSPC